MIPGFFGLGYFDMLGTDCWLARWDATIHQPVGKDKRKVLMLSLFASHREIASMFFVFL